MPLVFAAITPHSPLLVPTIGKENLKKLQKTIDALEKLEEDLYLSKPDIIAIISPHSHHFSDAFSISFSEKFESDLKEFGDLSTRLSFNGEMQLPYFLKQNLNENGNNNVVIVSEPALDYGSVVPLLYLTKHMSDIKLLPITQSELDAKSHLEFGNSMKEQFMESNKRIAVIASGNLSHALSSEAPAGYNENGPKFDLKIQELLSSHNTSGLLKLNPELLTGSAECGFRPILMLMGVLRDISYRYESYSYESPHGIGHLTANFVI